MINVKVGLGVGVSFGWTVVVEVDDALAIVAVLEGFGKAEVPSGKSDGVAGMWLGVRVTVGEVIAVGD
jgi:hypothetical protein